MINQKHFRYKSFIDSKTMADEYIRRGWAVKYLNMWDVAEMGYWRIATTKEKKLLNSIK